MIDDNSVEIPVIVDIPEVGQPGLFPVFEVGCFGCFGIVVIPIILHEHIDPPGIGGIGHPAATFGYIEIQVSVVVVIDPGTGVIPGIIAGRNGFGIQDGFIPGKGAVQVVGKSS